VFRENRKNLRKERWVFVEKKELSTNNIYTCPMHPEVQSDKPGKCPKCGMFLVEKKEDQKT